MDDVILREDEEESFNQEPPSRCPEGRQTGWIQSVEWGNWRESSKYPEKEIQSLIFTILPSGNHYSIKWWTRDILQRDLYSGEVSLCKYPMQSGVGYYPPSRGFIEDLVGTDLLKGFLPGMHSQWLHNLGIIRSEKMTKQDISFPSGLCSTLLGQPISFTVIHKPSPDGTRLYANIDSIGPWVDGTRKVIEEDPF
mgnify:CR=1 FL=1